MENTPWAPCLCNLSRHFSEEFMGSVVNFSSHRMKQEVHFVNDFIVTKED